MNTTRRGLLAASGGILARPALAAWPDRPVTLVVPYAAGGSTDVVARLLAPKLQGLLGPSFVVENRTGAGGSIGTAAVARGAADGTVFLVSSASNHVMYPIVAPNSMPDPRTAFAGVSQLADIPLALTVANRLGVSDMPGLLALLKREPGRHFFASSGVGGSRHLAGELFATRAGVDIVHVPYRGGVPALNDLVAGQVSLAFLNLPTALPQAEAGKVRILAVAGERRSALKVDIPTVTELGVTDFAARSWTALFAVRATPARDRRADERGGARGADRSPDEGPLRRTGRRGGGLDPLGAGPLRSRRVRAVGAGDPRRQGHGAIEGAPKRKEAALNTGRPLLRFV